jgi:hypothetical protein
MSEGDIGCPRALRTLSDCFFVRFDYWKQLEGNAGLKAVGGRLFPNPAFRNRSTECRAVAYGRYGTALRPGFADQRFRHIRHISRNAPFPQSEAFRIRRVSSQLSVCFVETNGAFDVSTRIQNTNLTLTEATRGFPHIRWPDLSAE